MRLWWYGGRQRNDFPEQTKRKKQWTQDITLSMDGEVCWNHYCPECAERDIERTERNKKENKVSPT